MLDFMSIGIKTKNGNVEVVPSFKVVRSKDLMIRGNAFYGIWDEEAQKWSTDEFEAIRLIDKCTLQWAEENAKGTSVQLLVDADNCLIDKWNKYCQKQAINNYKALDEELIFSNMERKRENYSSKELDYPLIAGKHDGWDTLLHTLYDDAEAHKIEWGIGAIVSGDSRWLQKFMVFYGAAGTGKSTILNIIQMMFKGYYAMFEAKALGSKNNSFALEAFRGNPLVAIQHDGDLSKIEDNTLLNSLVSHEEMVVNEKFKSSYVSSFKAFLLLGTNSPVKITNAKSGLIRRLIDVRPTGNKVNPAEYNKIMQGIPFELSGIAQHCLDVYKADPGYYNTYMPSNMLASTNDFYNFIADNYMQFSEAVDMPLSLAWEMYKNYAEDAKMPFQLSKRQFREELTNYFTEFKDRHVLPDGKRARSYYIGFLKDKFDGSKEDEFVAPKVVETSWIDMKEDVESVFDKVASEYPAQLTTKDGLPISKWGDTKTKLKNINTKELHFVKVPENHIVIDFDIPGPDGQKNFELNLEEAKKWPETYAEISKSGQGIHLHYMYAGDPNRLSRVFDEHIEVKVYTGNSSLRRKLSKCNDLDISTISSGLPLREEKKNVVGKDVIKNEKMLRIMILKNIKKEYHSNTAPSIDFIKKLLDDAYDNGLGYDVSDMRPAIVDFAMESTNQAERCLKTVGQMKFKSENASEGVEAEYDALVFYDIEVFPNLFLVNWKFRGKDKKVVRMINPSPKEIEELCKYKLIGFNNRRYDNHIMYARMLGYTLDGLFELSQRIINNSPNALFAEAYNLSYTDVYDFAAAVNKKSLKKFEIELGIKHHELGLDWNEPVPEELWVKVAEYCDDDVYATEATFDHLEADWNSRKILADIADRSVNTSTNALSTAIVFGKNKKPQNEFCYRDMSKPVTFLPDDVRDFLEAETELLSQGEFVAWNGEKSILPFFPGYKYEFGKSTYRGLEVGEGGYVEAVHGYHENVALLDVASMHPHSAIDECVFGPKYTKRYKDIVDGRIAIKHKDFQKGSEILDGKFGKYMIDDDQLLAALSLALKTPINSAYGLTSAGFENPWRDPRNVDNIIAKRGALFMIDLKYEVEKRGYTVAHIKTDSIKIPGADSEMIQFVMDFGRKYGYEFEHEATYKKMCLVNNAVYIAKYATKEECIEQYGYAPGDNAKHGGDWTATGKQFAVPYVFKTLFSKEPIIMEDFREIKSVKTSIYLDFNGEKQFIGKVGAFTPVTEHGGELVREATDKEGNIKYDSVTGAKDFLWANYDDVAENNRIDMVDKKFYTQLVDKAVDAIEKYVPIDAFLD